MLFKGFVKLTRLNRPTGIALLLLPCFFGIALAAKKMSDLDTKQLFFTSFLFFVGAIIMRSAGCVINDILDRRFDAKVARTKLRPLASQEISLQQALIFLGFLLFFGLIILLQFNFKTVVSGFVAMILVVTYPLMKRITYYPQLFLGLTFNFGILMASLALLNQLSLDFFVLYFAAIIWTVIYDTIYAYQDFEDDLKIGVKSTAIRFGENPRKILSYLDIAMLLALLILGWVNKFQPNYFYTILLASLFLNYQINKCDFKNSQNCLKVFKLNIWVGILILIAIIQG